MNNHFRRLGMGVLSQLPEMNSGRRAGRRGQTDNLGDVCCARSPPPTPTLTTHQTPTTDTALHGTINCNQL
ncbi:hypothetical protein J6590_046236 [Homalodisca vitripennis]|nr:hypothetical protein J6590_046236 [Homalodisca vitripennis]